MDYNEQRGPATATATQQVREPMWQTLMYKLDEICRASTTPPEISVDTVHATLLVRDCTSLKIIDFRTGTLLDTSNEGGMEGVMEEKRDVAHRKTQSNRIGKGLVLPDRLADILRNKRNRSPVSPAESELEKLDRMSPKERKKYDERLLRDMQY